MLELQDQVSFSQSEECCDVHYSCKHKHKHKLILQICEPRIKFLIVYKLGEQKFCLKKAK